MKSNNTRKKSKFQIELEKKASKQIIIIVLTGCVFFCVAIMVSNRINQEISQKEHLEKLKETFCNVEEDTLNFIMEKENIINYEPVLFTE